jgi:hypothetical protein
MDDRDSGRRGRTLLVVGAAVLGLVGAAALGLGLVGLRRREQEDA